MPSEGLLSTAYQSPTTMSSTLNRITLPLLEDTAAAVIAAMKTVPEFAEAKIAMIGGMALWKYLEDYRVTKVCRFKAKQLYMRLLLIDLVLGCRLHDYCGRGPKSRQREASKLSNTPFVQLGDRFFYKAASGLNIQIDMLLVEHVGH